MENNEIVISKDNRTEIINSIVKIDQNEDQEFINCGKKDEVIIEINNKLINKSLCQKCKEKKSMYYNRTEFMCKECFIKIAEHKFKSNLRAHCRIRHEDNLLVCISGGLNSMLMLHLFNLSLNESTSTKKMFFKIKFLFVDDSFFHTNYFQNKDKTKLLEERILNREILESLSKRYQFDINIINLESCLELEGINASETNFTLVDKLVENIHSINDINFKNKYSQILKNNLIYYYSILNKYNKIVFGNSQSNLVNGLFGNMILGRGNSINLKYVDDSMFNGRILILRPMKDYLNKEILIMSKLYNTQILYSSCGNINTVNNKQISKPFNGDGNMLIESVLNKLQDRMFSTTPTIVSTVDKIKLEKFTHVCEFCFCGRDDIVNKLEIGSFDMLNKET